MDFYGRISESTLPILTDQRLLDFVASFKHETYVTVSIKKTVSKRSNRQNKYWWLCMQLISDYTGFTKDEAHDHCKQVLCMRDKVNQGTGEVMRVVKSTTEYNKTEFATLVNELQRYAAETIGVVLPDPETQININI